MKVLVAVKRVSDPENLNKVKVTPEGKVDATGLELKPSPYDEYALETALRLTENGQASKQRLGKSSSLRLVRRALSKCCVQCSEREPIAPFASTRPMTLSTATWSREDSRHSSNARNLILVLLGYEQTENESNEVGQMLAEYLGGLRRRSPVPSEAKVTPHSSSDARLKALR